MSYCAPQILALAQGAWEDLSSPTTISVGYVSGWFTQSGNIGSVNNLLGTCMYLSGDAPCMVGMGPEEASIYQLVYLNNYYKRLPTSLLMTTTPNWTKLREGDSSVERDSTVNMAKAATVLFQETSKQLRLALHDYKLNHSHPASVDAASLPSWPTP